MTRANISPYDVILVPFQALHNTNSGKHRNDGPIKRLAGIKAASEAILQDPDRWAMLVISSKIAGQTSFDMVRQAKEINPRIKILIAMDGKDNHDSGNLQGLPFVDSIIQTPIESIDSTQILSLIDNQREKKGSSFRVKIIRRRG